MCNDKEKDEITIIYPGRPGFILEAYNAQQQLAAQFGLSVLLEEGRDQSFKVVLNGRPIYQNLTEDISHIDHKKIISSVGDYKKPLVRRPVATPGPDDTDNPAHIEWMNSVCSGE